MDLQKLEVFSSIAVLISVIVLIFEVRESTVELKRNAYDEAIEAVLEWRYVVASDPDFTNISYRAIQEKEELEGEERYRFQNHMSSLWLIYDRAFWAHEYGQMGDSEWERFSRNICLSLPPRILTFNEFERGITLEFRDYIKQTCPQFGSSSDDA